MCGAIFVVFIPCSHWVGFVLIWFITGWVLVTIYIDWQTAIATGKMASQVCCFYHAVMDTHDGHLECSHCLGVAHLRYCYWAPFEKKHIHRAKQVQQWGTATQPPPTWMKADVSKGHTKEHRPECTSVHEQGRGSGKPAPKKLHSPAAMAGDQEQQDATQLKILAAIQSL